VKVLFAIVAFILFAESIDLHRFFDFNKIEITKTVDDSDESKDPSKEENKEENKEDKVKEIDKYAHNNQFTILLAISSKLIAHDREAAACLAGVSSAPDRPPKI
jgi:hypothetical protein